MNQLWKKRLNIVFAITLVMVGALIYRLFYLQITSFAKYKSQTEGQYIVKKDLPANRGKIYASDMFPLATNSRLYQVIVVPNQVKDKQETAQKLAKLLDLNEEEIFEKINNNKYYIPPLKKRLSEEDGEKVAEEKLKGVTVVPESLRFYPENELASQILGFVDGNNKGRYGLEGYFDEQLRGISGEIFGEKDNLGRVFGIDSKLEPRDGQSLVLTVDHNVQYQAEEVLKEAVEKYGADSGTIIIMDPKTGQILGMTNFPTFNPNEFNKVPQEQQGVYSNDAIIGNWEPGSIFKPLIMAAAIEENLVQPETVGHFDSSVKVDNFTIKTSTGEAYGDETMTQVLENSDNVAMVWLSELLGKDKMYEYIKDFGFGRKTGIELDSESSGTVADPKKWSNSQRATISFGQGLTVTPLQILTATAALANEGKLMQPYIVQNRIDHNMKEEKTKPKEVGQVISKDTAKKVAQMMVSVVENGHGKRAGVAGYKVAGKTGTAQIPKPGGGYYADRHVGSFAGFAPADNPKFAMLVRLNNPKAVEWAESSAAPAFGEMAKWLLEYYQVPKDN